MRISIFSLVTALSLFWLPSFAEIKPFTFVHFSDPHIGFAGNDERLTAALKDVKEAFPEAELIIVTGDMTDFGFEDEYSSLTKILKRSHIPVYPAPGNHDVRWSNSGKENYRNALGNSYKTVDHKGVRFVLMDSSMLIEHYGHFDGQQLAQLEKDLKSLPKDEIAVLAMHHPPLSAGHFIDNEQQFAQLIQQYNVPLVCDGHGHALQRYSFDGVTYAMGGSTFGSGQGRSYRVFKVSPTEIRCFTRFYERKKTNEEEPIQTFPSRHDKLSLTASKNSDNLPCLDVKIGDSNVTEPVILTVDQVASTAPIQLNDKPLCLSDLVDAPGLHQLTVAAPLGVTTTAATIRFVSKEAGKPEILRVMPLLSGCQSHPVVDGDVLYVASNDGYIRAYDLNETSGTTEIDTITSDSFPSAKLLWEREFGREILSSPAVTSDTIVFGCMNKNVYCLDKKTGKNVWVYPTKQAVLASPLVVKDNVYIGSGDKRMHAIDLKSGKKRWTFQVEKLIKATPAFANGRIFFGAWDNFFYCLDAKTGKQIWKVPVAETPNGHFSAATSNPVISGDNVIFCSHDYTVRCLNQKTGSTIWAYRPEKSELGPSYSTAVVKDGIAYFGSINGHVVGHDVERGTKVFDVDVRPEKKDDLFDSAPLLAGNLLYVGSVNGNVYCVDIAKKQVEWKVALQPGFIFTRPALWKDHVFMATLNDAVYEIGKR